MRRGPQVLAPLLAASLCAAAAAEVLEPGAQIEDQLDVVQVDRRIIAVSSLGGTIFETPLELGEHVRGILSRGLMGIVTTNVRLLAATAGSSRFKTLRYRVTEREATAPEPQVADRVALVALGPRVAALAASSAGWSQLALGPQEELRHTQVSANLALVLTDRRAVAFSAASGGFVEEPLSPEEAIESVSLKDGSITLETPRRVLVFHAGRPVWTALLRTNRR